MSEQRASLCVCGNGGEWYADNNGERVAQWYCGACEDTRAERYGCALIIAEGVMCDEGACGCDGTGVLVKNYKPCDNCGDEWSETIEWSGRPLCEECYHVWHCGCEVCVKGAVSEWQKDNKEVAR